MDRYTKRDGRTGRAYLDEKGAWLTPDGTIQGCAIEDLAEYEDTGLSPTVCAEYKKFEDEAISKNVTFTRIVELMNAEAEGRLIVLPVKVGDTVWYLTGGNSSHSQHFSVAEESVCTGIFVEDGKMLIRLRYDWKGNHGSYGVFGKTVFTSRAAAEAALKEAQQG